MTVHMLATTDAAAHVAVVEGYNSNTLQVAAPQVRIPEKHGAFFTGVDASLFTQSQSKRGHAFTLRADGRVQHYTTDTPGPENDGAGALGTSVRLVLGPNTDLHVRWAGTVSTANAARLSDGTLFRFNPYALGRSFWLTSLDVGVTHAVTPVLRWTQSSGLLVSGTIEESFVSALGTSRVEHRGLDVIAPHLEQSLQRDLSLRTTVFGDVRGQYVHARTLYDLTKTPPENRGPQDLFFVTVGVGHRYKLAEALESTLHGGVLFGSPTPASDDPAIVVSPIFSAAIAYLKERFTSRASASYTYTSLTPTLGPGGLASISGLVSGVPSQKRGLRRFALLSAATFTRGAVAFGETTEHLVTVASQLQIRASLVGPLGVFLGYDARVASRASEGSPPFIRHMAFLGLSGFVTSDKSLPPLTPLATDVRFPQ